MSEIDETEVTEATPEDAELEQTAETNRDPLKAVTDFIRQHPGLTIAGGIAAGLLAGALIPKRTRNKLMQRSAQLAKGASLASAAFGRHAWERAESAGSDLRERGAAAAERFERYGETAADRAERLIGSAEHAASRAGRKIARKAGELKSRARR